MWNWGGQPQKNVDVVEPEVGVDDQDPFSPFAKGVSQIGDHVGLTDAAFSAADSQHPEWGIFHLIANKTPQCGCLIVTIQFRAP